MALSIIPVTIGRIHSTSVVANTAGDRVDIPVTTTAAHSEPATATAGVYRIVAGEACFVRIGPEAIATVANGELWAAGREEDRLIAKGHRVSVVEA